MTKILYVLTLSLLIPGVSWAQGRPADPLKRRIQGCYSRNIGDPATAAHCADGELARAIGRLTRRVNRMDGDDDRRRPRAGTIYSCSNDTDPILYKTTINSRGEVLRRDPVKKFTEGDDVAERQACYVALLRKEQSLPGRSTSTCSCTSDTDPALKLEVLDEDYQTIYSTNLHVFTAGDDRQERRDCQASLSRFSICQD